MKPTTRHSCMCAHPVPLDSTGLRPYFRSLLFCLQSLSLSLSFFKSSCFKYLKIEDFITKTKFPQFFQKVRMIGKMHPCLGWWQLPEAVSPHTGKLNSYWIVNDFTYLTPINVWGREPWLSCLTFKNCLTAVESPQVKYLVIHESRIWINR